jgi:hypothetical protein
MPLYCFNGWPKTSGNQAHSGQVQANMSSYVVWAIFSSAIAKS